MNEIREITVTRYVCPYCSRGRSSRKATEEHVARCWRDPANRSCKTCQNWIQAGPESDEACAAGVEIHTVPDRPWFAVLPLQCPKWEAQA